MPTTVADKPVDPITKEGYLALRDASITATTNAISDLESRIVELKRTLTALRGIRTEDQAEARDSDELSGPAAAMQLDLVEQTPHLSNQEPVDTTPDIARVTNSKIRPKPSTVTLRASVKAAEQRLQNFGIEEGVE